MLAALAQDNLGEAWAAWLDQIWYDRLASPAALDRLRKARPVNIKEGVLTLSAPAEDAPWLQDRTSALVRNAFSIYGVKEVRFVADEEGAANDEDAEEFEVPKEAPAPSEPAEIAVVEYYRLASSHIVQPDRVIVFSAYWLRWLPVLKPSGLSLLLALRQVSFLKAQTAGEVVRTTKAEIARWAGMTPRGVRKRLRKSPFDQIVRVQDVTNGPSTKTLVQFPVEPWLLPYDAERIYFYLFGVKQEAPAAEVLEAFAAETRENPRLIKDLLGAPVASKTTKGQRLSAWLQEWGVSFSEKLEAAAQTVERVILEQWGSVAIPWYLLKYRESLGDMLFWTFVWRARFAPEGVENHHRLTQTMGLARGAIAIAVSRAPRNVLERLFPNGVLGAVPSLQAVPVHPEDDARLTQLAADLAKSEATQPQIPSLALRETWSWDDFPKIDRRRLDDLKKIVTPAQFAHAVGEGYANEAVRQPLGLAIHNCLKAPPDSIPAAPAPRKVYNFLLRIYEGAGQLTPSPWSNISPARARAMLVDVFGQDPNFVLKSQ